MATTVHLIADSSGILEYAIVPAGQGFVNYRDPVVWWIPGEQRANCCACSGPLAAMSASCAHARRIRRLGIAGKLPARVADRNDLDK